jgi:hypothetical protein
MNFTTPPTKPTIRAIIVAPSVKIATGSRASEWCFDTRCFDLEKLHSYHSEHNKEAPLAVADSSFSIDITCERCRVAYTRQPSDFIYNNPGPPHSTKDFEAYLWIRVDRRPAFLEKLEPPSRVDKVKAELKKLSRDREEFARYGPKQRLLLALDGWRYKWNTGSPAAEHAHQGSAKPGQLVRRATAWARWNPPTTDKLEPAVPPAAADTETNGGKPRASPGPATSPVDPMTLGFDGHYSVGAMCFKRKRGIKNGSFVGHDFEGIPGSFPHQRVPIEEFLSSDEQKKGNSLLARSEEDGNALRYFHFPTNNMRWIEVGLFFFMFTPRTPYVDSIN